MAQHGRDADSGGTTAPRRGRHSAPGGGLDPETDGGSSRSETSFDSFGGLNEHSASFGGGQTGGYDGPYRRVRKKRRSHRRRRRTVIAAVAIVVVVVVAALGASGVLLYRSMQGLQEDARSMIALASDLREDIESGDLSGLPDDAQQMASLVSGMKSEVDGPLWTVASIVPVVGGDVSAARSLVTALDSVITEGLLPVSQDLSSVSLDSIFGEGGSINLTAVQTLVDSLASIAPVVSSANEAVQDIGSTSIERVTSLVDQAKSAFSLIDAGLQATNEIAPYLPEMLGADGETRTYLILALNNVEIRASGGFPGAQALLTVTDGQLDLGDFHATRWLYAEDALSISDEEHVLYDIGDTSTLGRAMGDATMTPDFPRAADLVTQEWGILYGDVVEGVIAVDPVFLQYLLELTGGITLDDGTVVDGTNAARILMSDTYWYFSSNDDMDEFFATAAGMAFDHVLDSIGDVSLVGLAETVGRGVEEGRVLIWSSVDEEQQALEAIGCAGELPDDPSDPVAGVYVNNYSYSKLDWYLTIDASVSDGVTHSDGTTTYRVTVTLTNTLTEELAAALPAYVGSNSALAYEAGDEILRLYLYAPAGGEVSHFDISDGGSDLELTEATHDGLQLQFGLLHLLPGRTCTVSYSVTTPAEAAGKTLKLRITPTAQEARDADAAASSEDGDVASAAS